MFFYWKGWRACLKWIIHLYPHDYLFTEYVKTKAIECYYESILNIYGATPIPKNSGICNFKEPTRSNCTFERHCEEDQTVEIKVQHCGDFYVYHLSPVRTLEKSKFFDVSKGGIYCGSTNDSMQVTGIYYIRTSSLLFWLIPTLTLTEHILKHLCWVWFDWFCFPEISFVGYSNLFVGVYVLE